MKIRQAPTWDFSPEQAIKIQKRLSKKVICGENLNEVTLIAGVDVSVDQTNQAKAAVVVLNFPDLNIIEEAYTEGKISFPYIPGLLSFREIPLLLEAFKQLNHIPDLIIVDGQGIAHPRKMGLASHLGLLLNIPTIGCAKSRLYGAYSEPGNERGSFTDLIDNNGSVIGAVLRTKKGVKPLFISVGHKIDLPSSIEWVLQCCQGYRLPEPTRKAHLASRRLLNSYSGLE